MELERAGKGKDEEESLQESRVLKPNSDEEEFINYLTMGIEETLQAHPMIKDVKMYIRPPINSFLLTSWERRHGVRLPSDLRAYYGSTNGFRLNWELVYADEYLKIGNICINTIQELVPLETNFEAKEPPEVDSMDSKSTGIVIRLSDIQTGHKTKTETEVPGRLRCQKFPNGVNVKAFQLDNSQPDVSTICLVYLQPEKRSSELTTESSTNTLKLKNPYISSDTVEPDTQIWFLDRSFQWHFLAPTFTIFYRMALFHLGLPEWTYRFTSFGISPWIEQIFWLVAPNLLQPICNTNNPNMDAGIWSHDADIPSEAAKPNPTPNMLTLSMFKKKRKDYKKNQQKE